MDRCILEIVIENLAKLYEDEEREIHYREQADKKRRVREYFNFIENDSSRMK